jgi:hypothetical protein
MDFNLIAIESAFEGYGDSLYEVFRARPDSEARKGWLEDVEKYKTEIIGAFKTLLLEREAVTNPDVAYIRKWIEAFHSKDGSSVEAILKLATDSIRWRKERNDFLEDVVECVGALTDIISRCESSTRGFDGWTAVIAQGALDELNYAPIGDDDLAKTKKGPGLRSDLKSCVGALEMIIIRCREGDPRSNWLPIIQSAAESALDGLKNQSVRNPNP